MYIFGRQFPEMFHILGSSGTLRKTVFLVRELLKVIKSINKW